jgi:hypothetical protein
LERIRVLVADDEAAVRDALADLISSDASPRTLTRRSRSRAPRSPTSR